MKYLLLLYCAKCNHDNNKNLCRSRKIAELYIYGKNNILKHEEKLKKNVTNKNFCIGYSKVYGFSFIAILLIYKSAISSATVKYLFERNINNNHSHWCAFSLCCIINDITMRMTAERNIHK